jgi:hypothetical protein
MIEVSKIREQLKALVDELIPLDQFEDWLVQESWNMHAGSDQIAQALVSCIELRLAEYSNGHLPLAQMIDEFRLLLNGMFVVNVRLNADPVISRSGSSILLEKVQQQAQYAGRPLLTVYA